ncbi:MAG: hypothetical protein ABEJ22_01845 [Haloferacaceae archaeon]
MPVRDALDPLLFGRDPRRSVRLLSVAGVLFLVTFVLHTPSLLSRSPPFPFGFMLPLLWLASFVPAAAGAYGNDGLFVSVALAAGPSLGFYLPLALFDLAYPSETLLWGLGSGVGYGVVLGVLGFVVGAGVRRLVDRARSAAPA